MLRHEGGDGLGEVAERVVGGCGVFGGLSGEGDSCEVAEGVEGDGDGGETHGEDDVVGEVKEGRRRGEAGFAFADDGGGRHAELLRERRVIWAKKGDGES